MLRMYSKTTNRAFSDLYGKLLERDESGKNSVLGGGGGIVQLWRKIVQFLVKLESFIF